MDGDLNAAWVAGDTYCLRESGEAVIYCTDAPGLFPIHGRFIDRQDDTLTAWTKDGRWSGAPRESVSHPLDLSILHKV